MMSEKFPLQYKSRFKMRGEVKTYLFFRYPVVVMIIAWKRRGARTSSRRHCSKSFEIFLFFAVLYPDYRYFVSWTLMCEAMNFQFCSAPLSSRVDIVGTFGYNFFHLFTDKHNQNIRYISCFFSFQFAFD